ncbi:MAG: LysR family transcriptional regulator [Candidatus Adiutrix sp.]|jgi:DNA-binding transcriptional LysR family regulator|nr:LysR family transcriptional regulator [Candidatus Adiutrix sp.]
MDPRKLEIFLKLLETRSFSKTAAILGLAQPSVSASLKALEEILGQKLFERTPRSVTPLPAAETLAPYAISIVETAARAAWAVGQRPLTGEKITLGASSVPAVVWVPPTLRLFHEQFANIILKIRSGRSRTIIRQVADGELDLGLVGAPPEDDSLARSVIGRDRLVLLASRTLAKKIGRQPEAPEDLLDWPLIMREEGSGTRAAFLTALGRRAGDLAGRMNVRAEAEGFGPALALVRESFGAAVVSDLLPPFIDMKSLVALELKFFEGRRFYLVSRRAGRPSPALAALGKILKTTAPKQESAEGE